MILQRSNHPSVMLPKLWLLVNPYPVHSITDNHKVHQTTNIEITTERSIPNNPRDKNVPKRTIKKVIRNQEFTMIDKKYFECCVGLSQLKKRPLVFDCSKEGKKNLDTVIEWLGLQKGKTNRQHILESLTALPTLKIGIEDQNGIKEEVFRMSSMVTQNKTGVEIDGSLFEIGTKGNKSKPFKKYIFNTKSERLLSFMDFIIARVQQRNIDISKDHPRDFRYREFTKMDVLSWFGLWDEYTKLVQDREAFQLLESTDPKVKETKRKIKNINRFISETIKEMETVLSQSNETEFPLYKYNRYTDDERYQIKDYRYRKLSNSEKIDEIYERTQK